MADEPQSRVLVVEDDPVLARALRTVLERRSLAVDWCSHAEDAMLELAHKRYSAVILDIILPGGSSGLYVVSYLHNVPKERRPPVVVITGSDTDVLRKIDRSIVKTVLFKPLQLDVFATSVEAMVRAHEDGH